MGKLIPQPKLSKTELMIGLNLIDRHHEVETSLAKHDDGTFAPIEVKLQDTTFGLGFKPTRKYIKATMPKKREKRYAKATGQTFDATMEISHSSASSPVPFYTNINSHITPSKIRQTSVSKQMSWPFK